MSEERKEACVKSLAETFEVDAVAVKCGDSSRWSASLPGNVEVIGLDDYRDSEYEATRRRFSNISRTFNKMNEKELEDLFRRVFELVRNVRMYDPHIGTGNTKSFLEGIDYMLGVWSKYSRIREKKSLRIVTAFKPHQKNYPCRLPQQDLRRKRHNQ